MATSKNCKICDLVVDESDSYLELANNEFAHPKCFKCVECGKEIPHDQYMDKEKDFYDINCYIKKFSKPCNRCGETLHQEYITVGEDLYHPDCFVCDRCKNNICKL